MSKLALMLLLVLVAACGSELPRHVSEPAQPADWSSLPPGWSQLPAPPYSAACAVSVWTGRELVYWGGDDTCQEGTPRGEGAAFDPTAAKWRRVSPSPVAGRSSAGGVWTGEEVLVWGGWSDGVQRDGAAYNPATDKWRMLPDSPLSPRIPVAAVWTGREMLVWGDVSRAGESADGAAYEPATDSWHALPDAPFGLNLASGVWTGEEMIVFGALLDGNNHSATEHARGAAYDPERASWRIIAPYPLSPQASTVVWTGAEMIAWDYELRAGAYDPRSDTWRPLPGLPLDFYECYPEGAQVGSFVFAWHCGQAAILDLAEGKWRILPSPPTSVAGRPVAADGILLFAGAWPGVGNTLWAYRPGPLGPTAFVPPAERRGDREVMSLTFPDGTHIVLSYPLEITLAELGVQPDVSYLYRDDPAARFPLGLYFGGAPPDAGPVVLEAGSWTVTAPGRDEVELDLLRRSIRARETSDGLIALEALPPLGLAREFGEGGGPQLGLGDLDPDPERSSLDPLILLAPNECGLPKPEIGGSHGAMCLDDIYVGIYGDRPFIEAVIAGLELEEP